MNAPLFQTNERFGVPVRFSESVERVEPDEAATIQGLIAAMRYVNEKTLADGGRRFNSLPQCIRTTQDRTRVRAT